MTASMIICAVLVILGLIFMLASLIGIALLPDFFSRLHAQGVGDTLGAFLILAGMMAAAWGGLMPLKILLIFIVIVLTNPIGTNLMMIAAINKEDYLGYRTLMSGEKETEPDTTGGIEAAADAVPETIKPAAEKTEPAQKEEQTSDIKPEEKVSAEQKEKTGKTPDRKSKRKPARKTKEKPDKDNTEKPVKDNKEKPSGKTKEKTDGKEEQSREPSEVKPKKKKPRKHKPSMSMNKAELIEAAERRGIEVPEKATKREILDLIYSGRDNDK